MDIPALLDARGIEYQSGGEGEILIPCPAQENHSDGIDSHPSCRINLEKQVCFCFVCGFKLGQVGMQKWLLGDELDEEQLHCLSLRSRLKKIHSEEDLFLEEAEHETFMPPGVPWNRDYRGISAETYRKLGAVECQRGRYTNRICFPIRQHGRLLGVDARALGDEKPKYLRPKGCNAREWLFPFDLAQEQQVEQVILCEGIFHAINYYDKQGVAEALCYFGAQNWSEHKTLLLLELAPQEVIIWPDNDKAGIEAMNKIAPLLSAWFDVFTINTEKLADSRDLGDFGRAEIEGYLKQKRRYRS